MRLAILFAALTLSLSHGSAHAQERLVSPELPRFYIANSQSANSETIVEEILIGETLDDWTQMVTTLRMVGAQGTDPLHLARTLRTRMLEGCADSDGSDAIRLDHTGAPGAFFVSRCPATEPGMRRQLVFTLIVAGDEALHMKQVILRRQHERADAEAAMAMLEATQLCRAPCDD